MCISSTLPHGKGSFLSENPTEEERKLHRQNELMRNQNKYAILKGGLLPKFRDQMLNRRTNAIPTYEEACQAAITGESIIIEKELSEKKGLTAAMAGIALHEEVQDAEIKKQREELNKLQQKISNLNMKQGMECEPLVAAINQHERSLTPIRKIYSANDRRRSHSETRLYDRQNSQGEDSPTPPRYSRDNRERHFSRERSQDRAGGKVQFEDWRARNLSRSRESIDKPRYFQNHFNRDQNKDVNRDRPRFQRDDYRYNASKGRNFQQDRTQNFRNNRDFQRPVEGRYNNLTQLDVCHYCKKPGHWKRECRKRIYQQKIQNGARDQSTQTHN